MAEVPISPTGLDFDLACAKCEYNLRGLSPEGNCPQCGSAIADSHRADILQSANRGWIRMLCIGASCSWLALLLLAISTGISILVFALMGSSAWMDYVPAGLYVLSWLSVFAICVGLWCIASREPSGPSTRDGLLPPVATRVLAMLAALSFASSRIGILPHLAGPVFSVCLFGALWSGLRCADGIVIQLPTKRLARFTRWVSVLLAWLGACFLFFAVLSRISHQDYSVVREYADQIDGVYRFLVLGTQLTMLLGLFTLARFRKPLRRVLDHARVA